jgi:hypothetical protein
MWTKRHKEHNDAETIDSVVKCEHKEVKYTVSMIDDDKKT